MTHPLCARTARLDQTGGKVGFLTHNDKLYAVMLVTANHPCPRGRHAVSLVKTRHHDPRKKKKKK